MFQQVLNPAGNMWLTVLISLTPLVALLFMLAALRMTAWLASILAGVITIPLGVLVWHAPWRETFKSYLYGGLTGVWVIDWITFWGLIIFNTLVLTGLFDRFKSWIIHHTTADIRIQTIMLAWAFGALLEGLVGFGYPWAVVVPILVGLGIADLDAIRVAALANNAPVSYGALGAPILGLAAVTGLPLLALSASIGNIVAVLALLPPWILIYLVSGWQGMIEAWPLAIVGSVSYIAGQWPVAHFLGPYLPDLAGALASFWILFLFVKVWHPKIMRGFGGAPLEAVAAAAPEAAKLNSVRESFIIWVPYLVLIVVVVAWTGPWSHLPGISWFRLSVSAISSVTQKPISSVFNFAPFGGGTSTFVSWLVIMLILRPDKGLVKRVFLKTFQANVGRAAGGFFYLRAGLHFCFHGNGELPCIRAFENRPVFRGSGARAGLDRSGPLWKQCLDERHVWAGASRNWQAFEPASAFASLIQFSRGRSGKAYRAPDSQRGRIHEQIRAQRRPSNPAQHGLDSRHAGVFNLDQPRVLLLSPRYHVSLKFSVPRSMKSLFDRAHPVHSPPAERWVSKRPHAVLQIVLRTSLLCLSR